jgi:uncharacterized protein YidB (DUF937 family)
MIRTGAQSSPDRGKSMGILDSVVGTFNNAEGGAPGATGTTGAILSEVLVMLQNKQAGGLSGLVQAFENGGLGHLVQSWVGTGQNLPVSPDQISNVLGSSGVLGRIAQATGLQQADVAQRLSALLPQIVDHLTPNGQIHQGDVSSALSTLAQKFLHG